MSRRNKNIMWKLFRIEVRSLKKFLKRSIRHELVPLTFTRRFAKETTFDNICVKFCFAGSKRKLIQTSRE